jgi:hypothetical protein
MDDFVLDTKRDVLEYTGHPPLSVHDAFDISIAKWKTIVLLHKDGAGSFYEGANTTCGLCMLYWEAHCYGCPIAEHTGTELCHDTPYYNYDLEDEYNEPEDLMLRAQDEVDFLVALKEGRG